MKKEKLEDKIMALEKRIAWLEVIVKKDLSPYERPNYFGKQPHWHGNIPCYQDDCVWC